MSGRTKNANMATHLLPLEFACHCLGPLDHGLDVAGDAHPEVDVDLRHPSAVVLVHPGHHLVPHEQAKLLLELALVDDQQKAPQPLRLAHLWLSQTTTNRHDTCSQYALSEDRPEQVLHVRSKSEGDSIV